MYDDNTLAEIARAIGGAKWLSLEAQSNGVQIGPKGAKVTYNDHVWTSKAQTFPYKTAYASALEALEDLDVAALHATLKPRVLTAEYRVPKKEGGGVRIETLTVADLEAARLALIHSLKNPKERAANYRARDAWEHTEFKGIVRSVSSGRYAFQLYREQGTVKTVEEPANGWHTPNSKLETRARAVVQGATRLQDFKVVYFDNVRTLRAGGSEWRPVDGVLTQS